MHISFSKNRKDSLTCLFVVSWKGAGAHHFFIQFYLWEFYYRPEMARSSFTQMCHIWCQYYKQMFIFLKRLTVISKVYIILFHNVYIFNNQFLNHFVLVIKTFEIGCLSYVIILSLKYSCMFSITGT